MLRHVGRLTRTHVVALVVQRRGLLHHQLRQLHLDVGLRERVRNALMGSDRFVAPHHPLLCVLGGHPERVAGHADRKRGGHDPFRVEPRKQLIDRRVLGAHQRVGGQPDVIEKHAELPIGADDIHLDLGVLQPGGVGGHDKEHRLERAGGRVLGSATTSTLLATSTHKM